MYVYIKSKIKLFKNFYLNQNESSLYQTFVKLVFKILFNHCLCLSYKIYFSFSNNKIHIKFMLIILIKENNGLLHLYILSILNIRGF